MVSKSVFPISPQLKQIDNYILNMDHVLGKGSSGSIVLSYDTNNHQFLAVKIISLTEITDPKAFEYMKSEIVNMQMANHPNIVRLIDVRRSKTNIYLIMEYCEGGNLESYIYERGGRLSEKESLRILKKIVRGYQYLHSLNIVHRDLKLANILTHQGEVKIADLGYSKLVENIKKDFLLSRVGTMLYMSPQILAAEHYTDKTDVWSLGVMYYQMLFGRSPWNISSFNNSVVVFLKTIREQGLVFPKDIKVSQKAKNLIQEMLMFDEEDRLSWEEIFQEAFLKDDAMEIESSLEEMSYFTNNKTLENIYECQQIFSKSSGFKPPELKLMQSVRSQELEKGNSNSNLNKKQVIDLFIKKAIEQKEKALCNKILRFLLQIRNKAVFILLCIEEAYLFVKETEGFQSILNYPYKILNKCETMKSALKVFKEEDIENFKSSQQNEILKKLLEKEKSFFLNWILNKKGKKDAYIFKKNEFIATIQEVLKKSEPKIKDSKRIRSYFMILLTIILKDFPESKLLAVDFNKIYEEIEEKSSH